MSRNKTDIIESINNSIPDNLHIIGGNALRKNDFNKCKKYLKVSELVAVINEGLLRYLTFQEKRIVAKNVYNLLSEFGGVWITCDVTPKKFIQNQNKNLPDFNKKLSNVTSRNNINDRFEDINHIR